MPSNSGQGEWHDVVPRSKRPRAGGYERIYDNWSQRERSALGLTDWGSADPEYHRFQAGR